MLVRIFSKLAMVMLKNAGEYGEYCNVFQSAVTVIRRIISRQSEGPLIRAVNPRVRLGVTLNPNPNLNPNPDPRIIGTLPLGATLGCEAVSYTHLTLPTKRIV